MSGAPILVSACLAGVPCRYDGSSRPDPAVVAAVRRGEAVVLCPEEGLGTPRSPAEIVGGTGSDVLDGTARILDARGTDVTEQLVNGARRVAQEADRLGVTGAVLQARSPSCGCGAIYDGSRSGHVVEGDGVLAALLKRSGIGVESRNGAVPGPGTDKPGPTTTAPHVTEPHVTEPHVTEPHVTEPHVTEPHVTDTGGSRPSPPTA